MTYVLSQAFKATRGLRYLTAMTIVFGTTACATGGDPYDVSTQPADMLAGIPVEPAEVFVGDYITVKAPASEHWFLNQSSGNGMIFGKEGASRMESYIAAVSMFELTPTNTPAAFEELIRGAVRKDIPLERYQVQRESLNFTEERGYPCVRYQTTARDKNPRGSDAPLLLAIDGLYCRHPQRQDTGFAIIYSFRGKGQDPHLRFDAESFIQGVQVPGRRMSK